MTPNEKAFIRVATELRQLETGVAYAEIALQITTRLAVGDGRYSGETTLTKAKRLARTTNVHEKVLPLVGFIDQLAQDMEGLEDWVEWAKARIILNRELVDAYAAGGDVVQARLSSG